MSLMAKDLDNLPIPVLGVRRTTGTHQVAISSTTNRNATAFHADTRVVTIYATIDCFIEQGLSTVTATTTRHFVPAGNLIDLDIGGGKSTFNPHIAVISTGGTGTLHISERE